MELKLALLGGELGALVAAATVRPQLAVGPPWVGEFAPLLPKTATCQQGCPLCLLCCTWSLAYLSPPGSRDTGTGHQREVEGGAGPGTQGTNAALLVLNASEFKNVTQAN